MDPTLLSTKLRSPPLSRRLVPRPGLLQTLERNVHDHKLTSIAAPAGYGKTTLLAQWANASQVPHCWLSLGQDENDPDRFFRYLFAAWSEQQPDLATHALGLLLGSAAPDRAAVLAAFINAAVSLPEHSVIILDEYHLIVEPAIHEAMAFLLDHAPPTLHFVLAGRSEPPLPLARYRARRELFELGVPELRLSNEESAALLTGLGRLDLTPNQVKLVNERCEGWVAGVQLASLTLRANRPPADLPLPSGRHRFIADYLSQEVLANAPLAVQAFLLQTSILDRVCAPLCDAVTGLGTSQEMLERLERENLFLTPLDPERNWFRLHPIFADFLQATLRQRQPDQLGGLHQRAAGWYLANDLPDDAYRHAVASGDVETVTQVIERYLFTLLLSGDFRGVQRWLDPLPPGWFAASPHLSILRSIYLAFSGAFESCIRGLDDIEHRLAGAPGATADWPLARVTAIRCLVACVHNDLPAAEHYGERALRQLPAGDVTIRAGVHHSLGDVNRQHGHWALAKSHYASVFDYASEPAGSIRAAHVYGAMADLDLRQGHLRDADRSWQQALAAVENPGVWGRLPLPVIGWIYLRIGELLYERNDLNAAWLHVRLGLARAELGGDIRALTVGYLLACRLKLTEGEPESAAASLELARPLVVQAPFPDEASRFERCQLDLWLAEDRLRAAAEWASTMLETDDLDARAGGDETWLTLAHVLIFTGASASRRQALAVLERVLRSAADEGRLGIEIEALILRAVALWQAVEQTEAMIGFERALRLAEPEEYVRRFLDYGDPVIHLLHEARRRHIMPEYVTTLLTAAGAAGAGSGPAATLIEPLSEREQEVLRLVAAGLTNREIADSLSISAETVKKHASAIFGKLSVANRTEAAARARGLGLLD